MKSKIVYTDEPLGEVKVVEDFLPSFDELVFQEEDDHDFIKQSDGGPASTDNDEKVAGSKWQPSGNRASQTGH